MLLLQFHSPAAMAAVIPEKVHFEPGSEALKVSAELSKEPSLIAASLVKFIQSILSRLSGL